MTVAYGRNYKYIVIQALVSLGLALDPDRWCSKSDGRDYKYMMIQALVISGLTVGQSK